MSRFVVFVVVLLAAVPGAVQAAEQVGDAEAPPAPPAASVRSAAPTLPPPALRVDLGMGSPVGGLGLVYSRPVASWLGVEAGAGAGMSGLQLSGMAKLRLGHGRWWFTPGVGLSLGLPLDSSQPVFHEGHPDPDDDEVRGAPVTMGWMDVDLLGVEYRGPSGFVLQASAGATVALTRAHWDLIDMGGNIGPGDPSPQVRLGMGWAL